MSNSNQSENLLGIIAFVLVLVANVLTWFFDVTTFALIMYLVGLAIALFDMFKTYKGEGLSFKELINVSGKERIFSLLSVIAIIPFSYGYYLSVALESLDSLY